MMSKVTSAARTAPNFAMAIAVAVSLTTNAAEPVNPPPPPHKPYPFVVQNDVTGAYQYRTRILAGNPNCQRYATESDAAFLSDKIDDATKLAQITKIGAEAAAAGCLGP